MITESITEICPFCDRDVKVVLLSSESETGEGNKMQCSYCKKTWINSSLHRSTKKKFKKK